MSFIHHQIFIELFYVSGTPPGAGDTAVNKTDKVFSLRRNLLGEDSKKKIHS